MDKIRSTGMGGISADEANSIQKLESKLEKLKQAQQIMKSVNAYYRKHHTLDGCPNLTEQQIGNLKESMSSSWRADARPFESFSLSNNNAEIRRVQKRIETLTRQKEIGYVGWEFAGGKVEANTEDKRLQISFEEKPSAQVRDELKRWGFRWAPSVGAWQRQLNDNAIYAANHVQAIQPLTGERPTDIQKKAQRQKKNQMSKEKDEVPR